MSDQRTSDRRCSTCGCSMVRRGFVVLCPMCDGQPPKEPPTSNPRAYLSAERVRQLASLSGLDYMPGWVHGGEGFRNLQTFARMVVDDCATDVASDTPKE